MEWLQTNWILVASLALSVVTNLVAFIKLGSARQFVMDVIQAAQDKKLTDAEKIKIFDSFIAMAKDVYAIIKGLTPWRSKV
jgi:hypothetical protein